MNGILAMLTTWLAADSAAWQPAFHEKLEDQRRGNVAIAEPDRALTFARVETGGRPRVLAVTSYRDGVIEGIELTVIPGLEATDPVTLFVKHGYERLRGAIRDAPPHARVSVAATQLAVPADFADHHIAVGTNYPEHADDAGTTRPFLFPKVVQPGASGEEVRVQGGLLDYEIEIAVVPLEPLRQDRPPRYVGLMIANDFTDRATLMREVDRNDIESGKGFTTGKSFDGYLPLGNLLVIPGDWRTFVRDLELRLFVNGALRQHERATAMVWDIDEILAQVWLRKGVRWHHRGRDVALFEGDAIPARTLMLTGTPHGTVFQGVPRRAMVVGLLRWIFGGWTTGVPAHVIAAYADAAREAKAYLQPGDDVFLHVDRLGELRSRVVP